MISKTVEETHQLSKELLKKLHSKKNIIALYGNLGSGKTTFIQGLAKALGIENRILSPTFVIQRSYKTSNNAFKLFHHFDLYRLKNAEEIKNIGLLEILNEKGSLIAIEWPELIEEVLPKNSVRIRLKKLSETERQIEIN